GAGLVLETDVRAEIDAALVVGQSVDDGEHIDALGQMADARIDLAQLALAVDVLGILGPVAHRGCFGHSARHFRPRDLPQRAQLGGETIHALARDVSARSLARWAIAAHGARNTFARLSANGGATMPRSVISAVTSACGVTSKAGLRVFTPCGAARRPRNMRTSSAFRSSIATSRPVAVAASKVEKKHAT